MDSIRKPEITISNDMIGIKLPYVQIWECADMGGNEELVPDLDTLVDANGAASLSSELEYLANRLAHAHAVAVMEADRIEWDEDPETERPRFIRNSMAKRLGLETFDDTPRHAT
jgi:hypothetical protein